MVALFCVPSISAVPPDDCSHSPEAQQLEAGNNHNTTSSRAYSSSKSRERQTTSANPRIKPGLKRQNSQTNKEGNQKEKVDKLCGRDALCLRDKNLLLEPSTLQQVHARRATTLPPISRPVPPMPRPDG